MVDDIALIRSCWADGVNHVGSVCQMNTGSILAGRPSLGAWVTYGLGTENQDLPAFVVMNDAGEPIGGPRNWGNAWLPATFQGTPFRKDGTADPPPRTPRRASPTAQQRAKLDLIADLDRDHAAAPRRGFPARRPDRRVRAGLPDAGHRPRGRRPLARRPPRRSRSTGSTTPGAASSARCASGPAGWSSAGSGSSSFIAGRAASGTPTRNIEGNHSKLCARSDQPVAALITDLKRRGLLDETLVVWGGEFGRTPMSERIDGRDHNPYGFSMFLAGGGVKGGVTHGGRPTSSACARSRTRSTSTTCTPRSST